MHKELLYSLCHIESESGDSHQMEAFILDYASNKKWHARQDTIGNIYVTKGTAATYPAACAHMDTVHDITGDGIAVVELGDCLTGLNPVTMEQTGIGGDDKCGIYAALVMLDTLPACKAAFFVDEEIGCRGSEMADMDFFADCRFVLQADRRGNGDFITDISGPLSSRKFQKAVAPLLALHGYKTSTGAMSDVLALRDGGVGLSVANLSAGYYRPHQASEYINMADLDNCTRLMLSIAKLPSVYPFTPPPRPPAAPVRVSARWEDWSIERRIAREADAVGAYEWPWKD